VVQRAINRCLIGILGGAVLLGGLAACSQQRFRDGAMSEADLSQLRERFIDKASRELSLDAAQKAKLDGLAPAL
jgi:protein CpxP